MIKYDGFPSPLSLLTVFSGLLKQVLGNRLFEIILVEFMDKFPEALKGK